MTGGGGPTPPRPSPNPPGGAQAVNLVNGGTGYNIATRRATTGGQGSGLTVNIINVSGGVITDVAIADLGTNYVTGDIVTITGGNGDATVEVQAYPIT